MSIGFNHSGPKFVDLWPTKLGTNIMQASTGLLGIRISQTHSDIQQQCHHCPCHWSKPNPQLSPQYLLKGASSAGQMDRGPTKSYPCDLSWKLSRVANCYLSAAETKIWALQYQRKSFFFGLMLAHCLQPPIFIHWQGHLSPTPGPVCELQSRPPPLLHFIVILSNLSPW